MILPDRLKVQRHIVERAMAIDALDLVPAEWVDKYLPPLSKKQEANLLKSLLSLRDNINAHGSYA